jgi:hypothetical protein
VPVAATRLTDVGAADPQPGVLGGGGEQGGEQLAVGGLDRGPIGKSAARLADPGGEGIADLLELAEIEQARWSDGTDPVRDLDPAEARGDESRQLPLEPADLTAQLGARPPLIYRLDACLRIDDERRGRPACLPFEQIRHE